MGREMPIRRRSARLAAVAARAPGQYPGSWKLFQKDVGIFDESSDSSPDDPGVPRRSSRHIAWTCGASSVRLSQTRSLPGRLPVSKPSRVSRRTNSEPCASLSFPARVMDEDFEILRILLHFKLIAVNKKLASSSSWYPNDDMLQRVLPMLQTRLPGMDATKLKQRIDAFEFMVRKHLEGAIEIRENKELLLQVFSSVLPNSPDTIVPETQEQTIIIPSSTSRGQKRASTGSDMEHHCKRCSNSESINTPMYLEKREAAQEILYSDINMKECARKLERCGFSGQPLWRALDLLKADLEYRQAFMGLGHTEAKGYILYVLGKDPETV